MSTPIRRIKRSIRQRLTGTRRPRGGGKGPKRRKAKRRLTRRQRELQKLRRQWLKKGM